MNLCWEIFLKSFMPTEIWVFVYLSSGKKTETVFLLKDWNTRPACKIYDYLYTKQIVEQRWSEHHPPKNKN